jgi:hypothetical protein
MYALSSLSYKRMSSFCIDTDFNIMFCGLYLASFNVKLRRSEKGRNFEVNVEGSI